MTVYEMINKIILDKLKEGVVPWKKMWISETGHPATSLSTGKPYNGINQILLSCVAEKYHSPWFLTYKQARSRGGYIRSGEKGYPIVFFKCIEETETDENGVEKINRKFFLRFYKVFNTDQCVNVNLNNYEEQKLFTKESWERSPELCNRIADSLLYCYKKIPKILHLPQYDPVYNFITDTIYMPENSQFLHQEEYYSTLFHELIHSTGHKTRLKRKLGNQDEKEKAVEELIAEIGAIYMSNHIGLEEVVVENSYSYIQSWMKAIESDSRLFVRAASKAEKAFKYICENSVMPEHQSVPA